MASTYTVYGHLPSSLLKLDASWVRTGLTKTEAEKLVKEQRATGGVAEVVPDEEYEEGADEDDDDDDEDDEDEDADDDDDDEDEGDDEISVSNAAHAKKPKSPAQLDRDIAKALGKKYPLLRVPGLWHDHAGETRKQIAKERSSTAGRSHATRSGKSLPKTDDIAARVRAINSIVRAADGRNVYVLRGRLGSPVQRITRARKKGDGMEVRVLASGQWTPVMPGDMIDVR